MAGRFAFLASSGKGSRGSCPKETTWSSLGIEASPDYPKGGLNNRFGESQYPQTGEISDWKPHGSIPHSLAIFLLAGE